MKLVCSLWIVMNIPMWGFGQRLDSVKDRVDSLGHFDSIVESKLERVDSLDQKALNKIDAIQSVFKSKTDSIQQIYQKPLNEIDQARSSIQHKIDSLNTLHLPIEKLKRKIDSLTNLQNKKLAELNQKVEKLKDRATSGLKEVTLPPQMQESADKLTQSIRSYAPTLPNGKLQEFKLPSGKFTAEKDFKLPEVKNFSQLGKNIPKSEELSKITSDLGKVKSVTSEASGLVKDVQSIGTGKLDEVKQIDKTLEKQVLKMDEVKEFQKQAGVVNPLADSGLTGTDPEALKKQAAEMARKEAMASIKTEVTNHFAGKEQLLQSSMDKMTKLKGKYSDVKSMAELPKKLPNPLRDLPFIERIIPGLSFQIQKGKYFLLDVNASAVYRLTPRFSAGAGWVERLAFDKLKFKQNAERVYGPRAVFQLLWAKGINFRFMPELVNAFVPPQFINRPTDNGERQWVWSAFVGVKKDFTVFKNIKGNTEALYNLYDRQNKSPYQDKFAVRFGFEFPMKKRHLP